MRKAKEKLGAMRWRLTRPAAETLAIFRRADTAAAKGLVVLAAPILFLWIVLFHEDDASPYTLLFDLPSCPTKELRDLGGHDWVAMPRELAWSDLAGEVVIFVILGSAGSDENGADLRKTQEDLEANGERVTLIGIPSKRQQGKAKLTQFVSGRGTSILFVDDERTSLSDASTLISFLKTASGRPQPIGEWTKFSVTEGRDVRRYGKETLTSSVIRLDTEAGPTRGHSTSLADPDLTIDSAPVLDTDAVPVVSGNRLLRRAATAARCKEFTAAGIVCAVLTLFLYPGCTASPAEPNVAAIDGIIITCAVVLALEAIARQILASAEGGGAHGRGGGLLRPLFELFMFVNLSLDVSTLAAPWADRQTGIRILIAIRAARVSRVLRLWFLVQTWRQQTDPRNHGPKERFASPQSLARRVLNHLTLQAGALVIVAAVLASPYLTVKQNQDLLSGQVQAFEELIAQIHAHRVDLDATTLSDIADAFCHLSVFADLGVKPMSMAYTGTPPWGPHPCDPLGLLSGRHTLIEKTARGGRLSLTFDIRRQQQQEAVSTITLICFIIAVLTVLSVSMADAVDRQMVRPMDTVWAMLMLKSSEAYGAIRHLGFLTVTAEIDTNNSLERMARQLARISLCFRGLAAQTEAYLFENFLGDESDLDPATKKWLLGQAGAQIEATGGSALPSQGSNGGLQFRALPGRRISGHLPMMPMPGTPKRESSQPGPLFGSGHIGATDSQQAMSRVRSMTRLASLTRLSSANAPGRESSGGGMERVPSTGGLLGLLAVATDAAAAASAGVSSSWLPAGVDPSPIGDRATARDSCSTALMRDSSLGREDSDHNTSQQPPRNRFHSSAYASALVQPPPRPTSPPGVPVGHNGSIPSSTAATSNHVARRSQDFTANGGRKSYDGTLNRSTYDEGARRRSIESVRTGTPTLVDVSLTQSSGSRRWTTEAPWSGRCPARDDSELESWELDLFEYTHLELCRLAFSIFESIGAIRHGYCSDKTLWYFITELSVLYRHAVDVLQVMYHFIKVTERRELFTAVEKFALCLAAIGHDVDHVGVTNGFLIATSDPLAILYNDIAVLENHHLATLFKLFREKPHANVLSRCDQETLKGVRKILVDAVLHTDMQKHFPMVSRAQLYSELNKELVAQAARGDEDACRRMTAQTEDRSFFMHLFLHAADISNAAKPLNLQTMWAQQVLMEFFAQGDAEKENGLPVSAGFDRETTSLEMSQINFAEFIVQPLLSAMVAIFPELLHTVVLVRNNYHAYVDSELRRLPPKTEAERTALEKRRVAFERRVSQGISQAERLLPKPVRATDARKSVEINVKKALSHGAIGRASMQLERVAADTVKKKDRGASVDVARRLTPASKGDTAPQ